MAHPAAAQPRVVGQRIETEAAAGAHLVPRDVDHRDLDRDHGVEVVAIRLDAHAREQSGAVDRRLRGVELALRERIARVERDARDHRIREQALGSRHRDLAERRARTRVDREPHGRERVRAIGHHRALDLGVRVAGVVQQVLERCLGVVVLVVVEALAVGDRDHRAGGLELHVVGQPGDLDARVSAQALLDREDHGERVALAILSRLDVDGEIALLLVGGLDPLGVEQKAVIVDRAAFERGGQCEPRQQVRARDRGVALELERCEIVFVAAMRRQCGTTASRDEHHQHAKPTHRSSEKIRVAGAPAQVRARHSAVSAQRDGCT